MNRRDTVLLAAIQGVNGRLDHAVDGINRRFDAVDRRFDSVNERLDRTNTRIDTIIDVLGELRADLHAHTNSHFHDDDG